MALPPGREYDSLINWTVFTEGQLWAKHCIRRVVKKSPENVAVQGRWHKSSPCKRVADGWNLVCQAFTGCPGNGEPRLNRTGLRLFKAVSMIP